MAGVSLTPVKNDSEQRRVVCPVAPIRCSGLCCGALQGDPIDFAIYREAAWQADVVGGRAGGQAAVPRQKDAPGLSGRALKGGQQVCFVGDFAVQAQGADDESRRCCVGLQGVGERPLGADFPVEGVAGRVACDGLKVGVPGWTVWRVELSGRIEGSELLLRGEGGDVSLM